MIVRIISSCVTSGIFRRTSSKIAGLLMASIWERDFGGGYSSKIHPSGTTVGTSNGNDPMPSGRLLCVQANALASAAVWPIPPYGFSFHLS